ncbi:MAG: hypothetical protein ABJA80_13085, partial [bacterium]
EADADVLGIEVAQHGPQVFRILRTLQPAQSPEAVLWGPYHHAHAAELPPIGPDAATPPPS